MWTNTGHCRQEALCWLGLELGLGGLGARVWASGSVEKVRDRGLGNFLVISLCL